MKFVQKHLSLENLPLSHIISTECEYVNRHQTQLAPPPWAWLRKVLFLGVAGPWVVWVVLGQRQMHRLHRSPNIFWQSVLEAVTQNFFFFCVASHWDTSRKKVFVFCLQSPALLLWLSYNRSSGDNSSRLLGLADPFLVLEVPLNSHYFLTDNELWEGFCLFTWMINVCLRKRRLCM